MHYNHILQENPIYKDVLECIKEERRDSLYNIVFMPVLIEFVSWVLKEALKSGKKRLYFLARDGYQMYLAAQKLCLMQNLPIDCRYLKVSRYSMRLPEYHLIQEKCVEHICVGGIDVTAERIMKRAGLKEDMAQIFLPNYDVKRILNYNEVMEIKKELGQNQAFLEAVYQVSKEAYEPAIGYLRQEGLFDEVTYGLVDSGWIGTLQQSIAHLVCKPELEGYYFGLYEIPRKAEKSRYHAFYFTPYNGMKRKVNFSNCLFEAVFTSAEGMTIGYAKREKRFVPITDFKKNPNVAQVAANCTQLEYYMEAYRGLLHNHEVSGHAFHGNYKRKVLFVEKLLSTCMGNPTDWEVESFGNLLFSDDVLEGNLKKTAAVLSMEDIQNQRFLNKAMIMLGIKKEELHESAWIEGSIVRTGCQIRRSLFHAKLYKYFVYIKKWMKQENR